MLTRLNRNIKALQEDEKDHLKKEAKRNLLRGWSREKWGQMELEEKREVITQVLASVVVTPIPRDRSDKAPFDPGLLIVSWRKEKQDKRSDQAPEETPGAQAA